MTKKLLSALYLFLITLGTSAYAQNPLEHSASDSNILTVSQNLGNVYSVKDGELLIPLKVSDKDVQIENLTLSVTINGIKKEYTVKPETNDAGIITVKVPSPSTAGLYDISVSVNKVNGIDNRSDLRTAAGRLTNLTRTVDHKVVFEEFTGFGCGWCPRGLVALERARHEYGRNIVLISAHFDDPLKCREYNLIRENSLPSAHLDRKMKSIDPYFGTSGGGVLFGINEDIKKCAEVKPVAEVKVNAIIDGDKLIATSDVKFLFTGNGKYAIAFIVTEDGMFNEKWSQSNNYSQFAGSGMLEETDPYFDRWINGDAKEKGYVYDDVAIVANGVKNGIDNSIPDSFVEEESNIFEVEFDLKNLRTIQNRKNLNVCALLFDRSNNQIVNADYMSFEHETAIEGVEAEDENVEETARYTIDGRRINTEEKGINIVKFSDGTVKKVLVK